MKNAIQPLECLAITCTTPCSKGITVTTERSPNGWYRTVAYVYGNFYAAEGSNDLKNNLKEIRIVLALGGHEMPKQLAPVMSAKMPKKAAPQAPSFTDRRTEYAA